MSEPVDGAGDPDHRGRPASARRAGCVAAGLLLLGAALFYCTVIDPNLRTIVVYRIGTHELQRWAIGVLDSGEHGSVPWAARPAAFRDQETQVIVVPGSGVERAHVLIERGDMFLKEEILVGRPGFVPYPGDVVSLERLGDGVYVRLKN